MPYKEDYKIGKYLKKKTTREVNIIRQTNRVIPYFKNIPCLLKKRKGMCNLHFIITKKKYVSWCA